MLINPSQITKEDNKEIYDIYDRIYETLRVPLPFFHEHQRTDIQKNNIKECQRKTNELVDFAIDRYNTNISYLSLSPEILQKLGINREQILEETKNLNKVLRPNIERKYEEASR